MISVIVPVYNSEDTIAACIESILGQSFTDWELIIVDDGSTDNSGHICDQYKDDRIHVIHQANQGRTAARWAGVEAATDDWISFVDSDDTLPVDALLSLSQGISRETDIVLGNGHTLPSESRKVISMNEFRHLAVRAEGNIGLPWGSLYRRDIITPYLFDIPRHIMMGEDYIFWLRLVFSTDKSVSIVYDSVYNKGEEHTCNTFQWTSDYCYELNELRKQAIPADQHQEFLSDMLDDRLVNLFAVAAHEPRRIWKHSPFYLDIKQDMDRIGRRLSMKQRLLLLITSLRAC